MQIGMVGLSRNGPATVVGSVVDAPADRYEPRDVTLDGGNSPYCDVLDRAVMLAGRGLHFVDVRTSGGAFGAARGFTMVHNSIEYGLMAACAALVADHLLLHRGASIDRD